MKYSNLSSQWTYKISNYPIYRMSNIDDKGLASLIVNSRLSLGEISKESGIGKSTLSAIKKGRYKIREYHMTYIKDAIVKLKSKKMIADTQIAVGEEEATIVTLVSTFKSLSIDKRNKIMEYLTIFKSLN